MRPCEELRPELSRAAEGEAEPREALRAARHVAHCTACRILLARERRLAELLDHLLEDDVEVHDEFRRQVMQRLPAGPPPRRRRRGLFVAVVVLAALLGLAFGVPGAPGDAGPGSLPRLSSFELGESDRVLDRARQATVALVATLSAVRGRVAIALPASVRAPWLALGVAVPVALGLAALLAMLLGVLTARQLVRTDGRPG